MTASPVEVAPGAGPGAQFRLEICSQAPVRLRAHPGSRASSGCVVTFTQQLSDPATIAWFAWTGLWKIFGKNNQDLDFCDHAWEFFKRHPKS